MEEQEILRHLKPSRVVTGFGRNRVYRYGSAVPYKGKMTGNTLPDFLLRYNLRVAADGRVPDHITINEYHPKQSIDWHIDSKGSGEIITVLSLECDAVMGIKEPEQKIILPARSLLQLSGSDRWDKQHCIYPVPSHRWSIVFRRSND